MHNVQVDEGDALLDYYALVTGVVPLRGWATGDLATLLNAVTAEIEARAAEADEESERE